MLPRGSGGSCSSGLNRAAVDDSRQVCLSYSPEGSDKADMGRGGMGGHGESTKRLPVSPLHGREDSPKLGSLVGLGKHQNS